MKRALPLLLAAWLTLGLTLGLVGPAVAGVVVITTVAPLEDQSDEAVQDALDDAVGQAVDGAVQMGLRPIRLADAEVWPDRVVVQVLATDVERDEGDGSHGVPGLRPGQHLAGTDMS